MKKKNNNLLVVIITLIVLILGTVALVNLSATQNATVCKHEYSEYTEVSAPQKFIVGEKQRVCEKCGGIESTRINATIELPQLYLNGDTYLIAKDREEILFAEYIDGAESFSSYVKVKYQGHTAMGYDKKNYTIKFYKDESTAEKLFFSVNGWEEINKYCLKANYIDFSNARNIVSSNIWSDVVGSRENLDENIAQLEFYGGIDGFPVALFLNGEYHGIYTFNIPKDEDTYNIADEKNEALFVVNSEFSDSAKFKALITENDRKNIFDLEYSYNDDKQWPYESLNNLIRFVMENDGESFRAGIGGFLDVDAAIDYLITAYILGLTDNFSKNMILITYDGKKWIPNLYDMDTVGGLTFEGLEFLSYDFSLPQVTEEGKVVSGTDNLLWDRIISNFTPEFILRYEQLRLAILQTDNVISRYSQFINLIPDECNEKDKELYPTRPQAQVNHSEQISEFLKLRAEKLDSIINILKESTEDE